MLKTIVTGGCGYLGRGILRRAQREKWDWDITVLNRDEGKQVRVLSTYPGVRAVKGDVSDDVDYLARLFYGYDIVIHAGANKLVDVGERSVFELERNNITGSRNVALAAMKAGVKQVVGISSDKAVLPVNAYGMTKAFMERLFQEANLLSPTEFTCARYGNVVGSTISIVGYFQDQLRELGYIKVTVPEMTRFYFGVEDAIDAIRYCLALARPGSVVLPKMEAMSVADVARLVLRLDPDADITKDERVHIVGPRPGEKLHECLLHEQESVRVLTPKHERYYELRPSVEGAQRPDAFTITSDRPPLGQMPWARMESLIADAETL